MKPAQEYAPRLLPEVVVAAISDGEVLVATPDSRKALVLNDTAAIIVSLCTGEYSVRDIALLFSETLDLEIDRAERDIQALLSELRAEGLLESDH